VQGAEWRHPVGPSSNRKGREQHPVAHIAYDGVLAYAQWARKKIPTEAQWEFAARGGLSGMVYPWGNEFMKDGRWDGEHAPGAFPGLRFAWYGLLTLPYRLVVSSDARSNSQMVLAGC
jgi:formylglycine-generating enzyme required for sulfatase activity